MTHNKSYVENYYHNNIIDRQDGPAVIEIRSNGTRIENFYTDGQLCRASGPSIIVIRPNKLPQNKYVTGPLRSLGRASCVRLVLGQD
jgi:hypothetical protein